MGLRPGDVFFVRYRGADLTHERLAIWPTSREGRTDWMVLTPDGDKYVERLDGTRTQDSPARTWGPTTTHAGLGGRQVYRFQCRPDNEELKEMILRGRSQLEAGAPRRAEVTTASGAVVGLADFMGVGADVEAEAEEGPERVGRRVQFADDGGTASGAIVAGRRPRARDGMLLVCWSPGVGTAVGTELHGGTEIALDHDHTMVRKGGEWLRGRWLLQTVAPDTVAARRALFAPAAVESQAQPSQQPLGQKPRAQSAEADLQQEFAQQAASHSQPGKEDARTLWLDFDEQGDKYKPWRQVTQESYTVADGHSSFDGPASCLEFCKHLERHGGSPSAWLEAWGRDKRLTRNERVMHELGVLTEILELAGSRDQLNVGALACLERAARRCQALVQVYGDPDKPNWGLVKFYGGAGVGDAVGPALRSFVARRAKEEVEISQGLARVGHGGGGWAQGGTQDAGGFMAEGGLATPKGRGRGDKGGKGGKGGRGADAAPAPGNE